jgi:prohibitin 2
VESKVVAFQKYLTEQNNLKAVQVIANQTVAKTQARARMANATGESQAIKLITDHLRQSPEYLHRLLLQSHLQYQDYYIHKFFVVGRKLR